MPGLVEDALDVIILIIIIKQCTCMNECMIVKPSVERRVAADVFSVQEKQNTTHKDPN